MSNTLPPLAIPPLHRRTHSSDSNISIPPISSWSDARRAVSTLSSSPPRSSSPPMTPYSSSSHNYALIRSSPAFGAELTRHALVDDFEDLTTTWHGRAKTHIQPHLPGIKSLFVDPEPTAIAARPVVSPGPFQQTRSTQYRYNTARDARSSYFPVFVDSEDEEQEDDSEGISLVEKDVWATSFRVSAERGQWRYEPPRLPIIARPTIHRQSVPTTSPPPLSALKLQARTISEPAPSTGRATPSLSDSHEEGQSTSDPSEVPSTANDDEVELACVSSSDRLGSPTHGIPASLPSLVSDRESMDPEEYTYPYPSSPLPPSSPPLSSSVPASPMMRSISPLSFAPSSPHLPPSSPLSFLDSLPPSGDIEDIDMDVQTDDEADTVPAPAMQSNPGPSNNEPELMLAPRSQEARQDPNAQASSSSEPPPLTPHRLPGATDIQTALRASTHQSSVMDAAVRKRSISPVVVAMSTERNSVKFPRGAVSDIAVIPAAENMEVVVDGPITVSAPETSQISRVKGKGKEQVGDGELEALRTKDENGMVDVKAAGPSVLKEKRKKDGDIEWDGPSRKKPKMSVSKERYASASGVRTISESEKEKKKARKEAKRQLGDEEKDENKPAVKVKRQKKSDGDVSQKRSNRPNPATATVSSTSPSILTHESKSHSHSQVPISNLIPSNEPEPKPKPKPTQTSKDPETQALDAEICGMLIETMALSRASCLPASSLYKSAMQCRPALEAQRSEKEWMEIIERVLNEGEASRGGSGVFGKVESSFKDDSGRPLEAQWFYVPELDEDQERATLIRSMMPRPGKRSETKKYKQYYYRPLAKITRWDPEDDL